MKASCCEFTVSSNSFWAMSSWVFKFLKTVLMLALIFKCTSRSSASEATRFDTTVSKSEIWALRSWGVRGVLIFMSRDSDKNGVFCVSCILGVCALSTSTTTMSCCWGWSSGVKLCLPVIWGDASTWDLFWDRSNSLVLCWDKEEGWLPFGLVDLGLGAVWSWYSGDFSFTMTVVSFGGWGISFFDTSLVDWDFGGSAFTTGGVSTADCIIEFWFWLFLDAFGLENTGLWTGFARDTLGDSNGRVFIDATEWADSVLINGPFPGAGIFFVLLFAPPLSAGGSCCWPEAATWETFAEEWGDAGACLP